jgi:Tfp pilus assembly protein PilV
MAGRRRKFPRRAGSVASDGRRGAILLEVMLACAIVGISLAGFAVALQRSVEASLVARQESAMRLALQSRLAELAAEKVSEGKKQLSYSENVTVEQQVEAADFRNAEDVALEGLFRVRLRAFESNSRILPLETEALVYQP